MFTEQKFAVEHILLSHPRFNLSPKDCEQKLVKGELGITVRRQNNINSLLLNEMDMKTKLKQAMKICQRKSKIEPPKPISSAQVGSNDLTDVSNVESNMENNKKDFVLSDKCCQCKAFKEKHNLLFSRPLKASQLFATGKKSFLIEIQILGDGKELQKQAGVTEGACPFCEVENWDPKTDCGLPVSINPYVLKSESFVNNSTKLNLRSLERTVYYSSELERKISTEQFKAYAESTKRKKLTVFRKSSIRYENTPSQRRIPFSQFCAPGFHTVLNIVNNRLIRFVLKTALLFDGFLIERNVVTEDKKKLLEELKSKIHAYNDDKNKITTLSTKIDFQKSTLTRKQLHNIKKRRANATSKFKNTANTKRVEKLRENLRVKPGPLFTTQSLSWTLVKGGSFEGSDCYKIIRNVSVIAEALLKPQKFTDFELGSEAVLHLFLEWVRLRRAEFSLT